MLEPWRRPAFTVFHRERAGIVASNGNGEIIGYLTWWDPSHITAAIDMDPKPQPYELARLEVRPEYQRRGIATSMLEMARRYEPRVHHSPHMTAAGREWAKATGYAPQTYTHVPDLAGQGRWNA